MFIFWFESGESTVEPPTIIEKKMSFYHKIRSGEQINNADITTAFPVYYHHVNTDRG